MLKKLFELLKKAKNPFYLNFYLSALQNKINMINCFILDMPHLLVSTRIRLEAGPTILGDEQADPELMAELGAQLFHEKCNN